MPEIIICAKCEEDNTVNAMSGFGNMYRPEQWKNTLPWLKKNFYLCPRCLKIIVLDWIYDHINKDGEFHS